MNIARVSKAEGIKKQRAMILKTLFFHAMTHNTKRPNSITPSHIPANIDIIMAIFSLWLQVELSELLLL